MAAYKFTVKRGQSDPWEIALTAGTAEAQTDTISLNVDATKITRFEVLELMEKLEAYIHQGKWPPL